MTPLLLLDSTNERAIIVNEMAGGVVASSSEGATRVTLQELLTFCLVVIELVRMTVDLLGRRKE